ncbi:AAA family ATPase [Mycoplasmopsis alligatoris]|uniref:Uncharacterized protein n=1 Tax=Mycoplasmopsis alligatoris A21JP2 TaxID=747682 RepID=D4XWJ9_9BACT|nr:hypothetical protein [Mycoplasmopsis alligatoris]EFF41229.1 hypothetical protein MALL_0431 [Mycoplasmopsis alligatoris A21JP2]
MTTSLENVSKYESLKPRINSIKEKIAPLTASNVKTADELKTEYEKLVQELVAATEEKNIIDSKEKLTLKIEEAKSFSKELDVNTDFSKEKQKLEAKITETSNLKDANDNTSTKILELHKQLDDAIKAVKDSKEEILKQHNVVKDNIQNELVKVDELLKTLPTNSDYETIKSTLTTLKEETIKNKNLQSKQKKN